MWRVCCAERMFARLLTVIPFIAVIPLIAIAIVVTIIPVVAIIARIPVAIVVALRAAVFVGIALIEIGLDFDIFAVVFAAFAVAFFIAPVAAIAVVIAPFAALRAVFVLAAAEVGEHAEIMVGKLQIIFCLHPITIQLRILRQLFIFFEHLGGVSARTIVDARGRAWCSAISRRARVMRSRRN